MDEVVKKLNGLVENGNVSRILKKDEEDAIYQAIKFIRDRIYLDTQYEKALAEVKHG